MNVDYTKGLNQYEVSRDAMGQAFKPIRGATGATTIGKLLQAYFARKGMNKGEEAMSAAEQAVRDRSSGDMSRMLEAYQPNNPDALMEAMMVSENPDYQRMGMARALNTREASGVDPTSHIQNYEYYEKLSPEGRKMFDNVMRGATVKNIGGVPTRIGVSGNTPLSTLDKEVQAKVRTASDVETAKKSAAAGVKKDVEQKANAVTYAAFKTGMDDYQTALGNTTTGYLAGRIPAMTASQQIADGAKSVMLPLLKQLFRSAGEGVFTDKDQELLEGMLPTRKDHPEAATAKINMVNKVVAMKMGLEYEAPAKALMSDDEYQKRKEALTGE